jgi:hypothetical protein
MRFYSNWDQKKQHQLQIYISEEERRDLELAEGTRLRVQPTENGSMELVPDPVARSRLHRNMLKGKAEDVWLITYLNPPGVWPKTGRTELKWSRSAETGNLVVHPHDSPKTNVRPISPSEKKPYRQQRQEIPIDIPPKNVDTSGLKRRSMVGAAATMEDLKVALELLNDVLARVRDLEVTPYVENGIVKVKATVVI